MKIALLSALATGGYLFVGAGVSKLIDNSLPQRTDWLEAAGVVALWPLILFFAIID